jgi:soluble lytic murein transglycosylase
MKPFKKVLISCLLIVVLLFLGKFALERGREYFMKKAYPIEYSNIVAKESYANHLDPAFVYSVIKVESNFDPQAKSHAGAIGLMQMMPDTFDWVHLKMDSDIGYEEKDLYKPEINIKYGCKLLALLLEKYPQKSTALCAYNAGIGTVNSWLSDPKISKDGKVITNIPYKETKNYVKIVLDNYDIYRELYQFNSKGENIK